MEQILDIKELMQAFAAAAIIRAPKILVVILMSWILVRIQVISSARIVKAMLDNEEEDVRALQKRLQTLSTLIGKTCKLIIYTVAVMMILPELGLSIGPLIAGAGIFGLAVGFGSQSLVKDVVTGFFLILENQFRIGDYVKIAGISGGVEDITLRVTVLRDGEGTLHYVPNGQIESVSNMTKIWSRAIIDLDVAYSENIDRVMEVIREACDEMKNDSETSGDFIEDFEIPGVQALTDSSVSIRVMVKTEPSKQWGAMRTMRRRFKNKFDEAGIEMPFQQRTVWLRKETGSAETVAV